MLNEIILIGQYFRNKYRNQQSLYGTLATARCMRKQGISIDAAPLILCSQSKVRG
jgi:uncharacterized protein (DUF924 family)